MNKLFVWALLLAAACGAQAQTVWRCGADGRSYSDRPCADGQPLQMAALADTRTAADVQAARGVAANEKRLADSLRQDRLQREALAALAAQAAGKTTARSGGRAAVAADVKPKPVASNPEQAKTRPAPKRVARHPGPADDGIFRAVAPASRRTKD